MKILKMIFQFLLELFFDHKEEYSFSSNRFNVRKVMVMMIFTISVTMNVFLVVSFFQLGTKYLELQKIVETQKVKNNSTQSSDSQNPRK